MIILIMILSMVVGWAISYFLVWWLALAIIIPFYLILFHECLVDNPMPGTSGHTGAVIISLMILGPGLIMATLTLGWLSEPFIWECLKSIPWSVFLRH